MDIIQQVAPDKIMNTVYETVEATGLFAANDIKGEYSLSSITNWLKARKFIHIFGYIMEGRDYGTKKPAYQNRLLQNLRYYFLIFRFIHQY